MKIIEKLLFRLVEEVQIQYKNRLNVTKSLKIPFFRCSYDEAIQILQRNGVKINWGEDLGYEREKKLGEIM